MFVGREVLDSIGQHAPPNEKLDFEAILAAIAMGPYPGQQEVASVTPSRGFPLTEGFIAARGSALLFYAVMEPNRIVLVNAAWV